MKGNFAPDLGVQSNVEKLVVQEVKAEDGVTHDRREDQAPALIQRAAKRSETQSQAFSPQEAPDSSWGDVRGAQQRNCSQRCRWRIGKPPRKTVIGER